MSTHWHLGLGSLCALVSLLSVFQAPTYELWFLRLGLSEWGHWAACLFLIAIALMAPKWRSSFSARLGITLSLVAFVLSCTAIFQALRLAKTLPEELRASVGQAEPRSRPQAPARPAPFLLRDLPGLRSPAIRQETLIYIERKDMPLAMDLYRPQENSKALPGVLVIHGGSWQSGQRSDFSALNRYLAARGFLVADMDYRLAPAHPFPAALEDVRAAIAYLKAHASALGLDKNNIILLGRSAGGQLALLFAYTAKDPAIRGVISFYAPADMGYAYAHPGNPRILNSIEVLESYMAGSPLKRPQAYLAASPIRFIGPKTPATLLIHGDEDEFVWPVQSERLAKRLAENKRPYFLLRLPWATHACDANLSGPCGQITTYAVERFLAAITGSS